MISHIYLTILKAEPTNDTTSVTTEAQILLSLSCVVSEEGTNIQADPELYGVVDMVWESIILNTMI